jgi:hypothetical protein
LDFFIVILLRKEKIRRVLDMKIRNLDFQKLLSNEQLTRTEGGHERGYDREYEEENGEHGEFDPHYPDQPRQEPRMPEPSNPIGVPIE